jgi:DNA-binding beta-propeller fold protein YncE
MGIDRITQRELALVLPGVRVISPAGIGVARMRSKAGGKDQVTLVALDSGTGFLLSNGRGMNGIVWGREKSSLGPLSHPSDVAIDRSGRVAVTDTGNRRVVILQHDGDRITAGKEFRSFQEPKGIAADGRGGFYVCDRSANTVVHLDAQTGARVPFGLEISFDRPIAIASIAEGDRLSPGKKRRIAVADKDGARIRLFTIEGNLAATRDASSLSGGAAHFDDLDFDYFGNVFAVDAVHHRVHKLRDDLVPLDSFGSKGEGPNQFLSPRGIAIHRELGQVFITEENGGRYLWIGTDVRDFQAKMAEGEVAFSYLLTEESVASLRILDSGGNLVAQIFTDDRQSAGTTRGTWDGTAKNGAVVPAGDYVAEIRARATYSSKSSFEKKATRPFQWKPRS